jgi:hypothetical protein
MFVPLEHPPGHAQVDFGEAIGVILYDNTKIAVARILGDGKRQRTRDFAELQSHYLFRDRFGRPGKGNDKAKSRGWSVTRDGTSSFRFQSSRASKR